MILVFPAEDVERRENEPCVKGINPILVRGFPIPPRAIRCLACLNVRYEPSSKVKVVCSVGGTTG
jgi:hypothetical protein